MADEDCLDRACTLTEALALIDLLVHEDSGREDVAKGPEHLVQVRISVLNRQVVYEEVGSLRSLWSVWRLKWRWWCDESGDDDGIGTWWMYSEVFEVVAEMWRWG